MSTELEKMTLPAGFVVTCCGIPFELESDTVVLGNRQNLPLLHQKLTEVGDAEAWLRANGGSKE